MTNEIRPTAAALPCPYAKKCGACTMQNLAYEDQLRVKQAGVVRLLGRFGRVERIVGMEDPTHYRNKVQAAFRLKSGKVISGVYQSGSHRIIEVDECMLEDPAAAPILATIRKLAASMKIKPFDLVSGEGFLRHVLIRRGFATEEIMVVLVTVPGEFRSARPFVSELCRRHPEITTVVRNINPTDTPLFLGNTSEVLFGEGYITDRLCGLSFRISPRSFYQVNPVVTERLYRRARELAALTGRERVIDAYCGTGTIGMTLAAHAREVIGVEVNRDAVADAKVNAAENRIENIRFYTADAGDFMQEMAERHERADVVMLDPPRAGCSQKFLQSLLTLAPRRVVYISCNPETLARDLAFLTRGGYSARCIRPFDMFPYTSHVETAVSLVREGESAHSGTQRKSPLCRQNKKPRPFRG